MEKRIKSKGPFITKDVAHILGVTVRRVNYLIQSGRLSAERLGRDWVISKKALDKLIEERGKSNYVKSKILQPYGRDTGPEPTREGE